MPESWLAVAGFDGAYEVSNHGRVRSLDRVILERGGRYRAIRGRELGQFPKRDGHMKVELSVDGSQYTRSVHRLVAIAFLGDQSGEGLIVCHNDGDPANNRLENLRWDTIASNIRDSVRHGTNHWANKTHCPQDHPYDAENTYIESDGRRSCRRCKADSARRSYDRKRAERNAA